MIERVLPTEETETEYFNLRRFEAGHVSIKRHVTKIREGLRLSCGESCHVESIKQGGVLLAHGVDCRTEPAPRTEFVRFDPSGQGQCVISIKGDPGENDLLGVMILNGLFPHEKPRILFTGEA